MISLILVLISISLFGLFLVAGLNHINTSSLRADSYITEIELATTTVASTIEGFKLANGFNLPDTNWKATLGKDYGNIPAMSFDSEWQYKVDGNNRYVCLVAKEATAVNDAFNKISDKYPDEYTVENKCQTTPTADTVSLTISI